MATLLNQTVYDIFLPGQTAPVVNNPFTPTFINKPDSGLATTAIGTLNSSAAIAQNTDTSILNRANVQLPPQSTLSNPGNVQGPDLPPNTNPNTQTVTGESTIQ